jgi:predicted porin
LLIERTEILHEEIKIGIFAFNYNEFNWHVSCSGRETQGTKAASLRNRVVDGRSLRLPQKKSISEEIRTMKKSLLALALLSTFAGLASAQSNVTIYGLLDMGLDYDNGKTGSVATGSTSKWSVASGQTSGSRLGFKGSEDLGGGMSAIFDLESGLNADDGTLGYNNRLFGRQSWVGLKTNQGSVKFGRQYTSTYLAIQTLDPFTNNSAGDGQRAYGYGLGKIDPISRADNSVTYQSPTMAGFSALAGYGFGEQAGNFNKLSTKFVGANYANGPLMVLLSFQQTDGIAFAPTSTPTAALDAIVIASGLAPTTTTSATVKNSVIGLTYDIGGVKVRTGYGKIKFQAVGDMNIRNYLFGVTAPAGTGKVLASWNRTNVTDVSGGVSDQYAAGYSYPLSKRTNLYGIVAYTKNGSGVRANAWANGKSDREAQFGMKFVF